MKKIIFSGFVCAATLLIGISSCAHADVVWNEDFSDVSVWRIVYDPSGGSSIGALGSLYVNGANTQAAFIPDTSLKPFCPFDPAQKNNYTLNFIVNSLTSSASYDISIDEFDVNKNWLNTIWGVFPASTATGPQSVNLSSVTFMSNTAYLMPKITVHTGDGAQTVKFDNISFNNYTGNVFYIRPDGNDSNTGTANSPQGAWATIQKAADSLNHGDTVEVEPGTYNGRVIVTRSGLANQLVTFHANGEVIIDGQTTNPYCIKLDGASYIKIEGFTIANTADNGILLNNGANHNVILNNTCYNNGASGIFLNGSSTYNTVEGNNCYSNGFGIAPYGDRPCGIYLYTSSNYNTLDGNTCYNNASTGIWLEGDSSYCTVKNNKSYSNGYGGIIVVGGTDYNTVTSNLIYSNGQLGMDLSYGAHDNTISNNSIYNNGSNGIQSNNYGGLNYIKNNIIVNNGLNSSWAAGISIESGSSAVSAYNDVYNNGLGGIKNYSGLSAGPGDICLDPLFKSTDTQSPDFLKLKSQLASLYVNGANTEAHFIPNISSKPFAAFNLAEKDKYTLSFNIDSLTSRASYKISLDEFDANKNWLSTIWSVFPASGISTTTTGPQSVNLGSITFDQNTAYLMPKIIVNTTDAAQTVNINSMSFIYNDSIIWNEDFSDVSNWRIVYDPLGGSSITVKPDYVESPCIDSGSPSDAPSPQSGERIDMGAYDLYQHAPIQGGLTAEYFSDMTLTSLKVSRFDPRINFDWGVGSPDAGIGPTNFSARWTGQVKIDLAQNYTFYVSIDDGSRLWIDNQLVIDKWFDQGTTEYSSTVSLSPGLHDIKYEYYQDTGFAVAKLSWSAPSINKTIIPSDHLYHFDRLPQGQYVQGGLKGVYSTYANLWGTTSYVLTRIDPHINFDWAYNMPDYNLGWSNWTAKWKGKVRIDTADTYTFYTTSDDGCRLWVNNQVLIDDWQYQSATEHQGSVYLSPGLYDIELDYFQGTGLASCKLLWSSTAIAKSVIPAVNLYYKNDDSSTGGLLAEYYSDMNLTAANLKIRRIDPNIDFDWISFYPDNSMAGTNYSIRWSGQVLADYNETYTFYANSDDGLRLWVDNSLLIDTWYDHGISETTATINLTTGWHDIKVEYYQDTGYATAKLSYSSNSTPKTIIPQDHLRTILSAGDASINLHCSLDSAVDVQTPAMGHSGSIIQTGTGTVNFVPAKFANGVYLSGSDSNNEGLVQFSSSDLNKKQGEFEFWFKPSWNSDDGVWHHLFSTNWTWDSCIEIFKYSNNFLYFKITKDGVQHGIVSDMTGKWSANTWHHLAASYGPAGMKFYLDYQQLPVSWTFNGESPYTGALPDTFASNIFIGGGGEGGVTSDAVFDELKIYNQQIVPSDTAPVIAITSNQDGQTVNSTPVTISGTINDNLASVTINTVQATVSNGTFSASVPLSLGSNTITVTATDQSNNSSTSSISLIFADTTPPTAPTVTVDGAYTTLNTQLHASWTTCSDPVGINRYEYAIGTTQGATDVVGWTSVGLNTQVTKTGLSLAQGQAYYFSVAAINNANLSNIGYSSGIIVDSTAPSGTVVIDNSAQYTNSTTATLTLSATDSVSGLSQMQFSNDNTTWSSPETYATTKSWTLTTGDGSKTVYVEFKDAAGNWSTAVSNTITLKTTPPSQPTINTVTSPTNINSQTVTGANSTDTTTIIVTSSTATIGSVTYQTSTTWSCVLTNLTEGSNSISVIAQDAAGNQSTPATTSIILDTTVPVIAITSPANNSTSTTQTITVSGTINDNQASVMVNGTAATVSNGTFTANNITLTQGSNTVTATATDMAGNTSSASIIVTYQPPVTLSVAITSPADNSYVNTSTITVSGTVSDSTATVWVTGRQATITNNTFTVLNVPLQQGTNAVTATATKGSSYTQSTIHVTLKTTPPTINIYIPDANSTTRSNIVYGSVSNDTQSVTVNGTSAEILSDFTFIGRPILPEGTNAIAVQATDKAGNTSQKQINITYNTQTPKVTITSPADNSEQDISPITVQGIDTSDLQYILVGSLPATIDGTNFTVGAVALTSDHTVITARGDDANGNLFEDSIFVTSPQLADYQFTGAVGSADEYDDTRPVAGTTQTLIVTLQKNGQLAPNQEVDFNITEGNGTLSQSGVFTDSNGNAQVILTTDSNSSVVNDVDCVVASNPLVKGTFVVYTKPGLLSSLTKISVDSITPIPVATVDLIVKLTDSNNNPIPNENINFQITQGTGTLSAAQAATTSYGEAKVNLNVSPSPSSTMQVTATSATNPNLSVTFNFTNTQATTLTYNDVMASVQQNESLILDFTANVVKTSNEPGSVPEEVYAIWQKGNNSKMQDTYPTQETHIMTETDTSVNFDGEAFLTVLNGGVPDPDTTTVNIIESCSGSIYVLKSTVTSNDKSFEEVTRYYVDYSTGILLKTEVYYRDPDTKEYFDINYSYIQISGIFVPNNVVTTTTDFEENATYTTTMSFSNIIINSGLSDSIFQ